MSFSTIKVPDDVVSTVVEDETVVLNLSSGEYYTLNSVGTRAWQLIREHGRREAVVDAMVAEFAVSDERLCADLDLWLDDLVRLGLVVVS